MAETRARRRHGPTIAPPASARKSRRAAASARRVRSGRELRQQRELLGARQTRCAFAVEAPRALVGEGALERARGGRGGGRRRRGRRRSTRVAKPEHVARQPQRQRPRSRPVRDLVAGEPLVVGLDDPAGVTGGLAPRAESSSPSGIESPIALAVPCQPSAPRRTMKSARSSTSITCAVRPSSGRERGRPRSPASAKPPDPVPESVGGIAGSDDESGPHDRRAIAERARAPTPRPRPSRAT